MKRRFRDFVRILAAICPPPELVGGMSPLEKGPPEGPHGGTKIDPKSKKSVLFSMSKHDHFLGRLQDQLFLCFGIPGGSKPMLFRVPEWLPACLGSFYAHMQILSPLPCFF